MISEKLKSRTNDDLLNMIENHSQFQRDFVLTAYHELKRRKIEFDESEVRSIIEKIEVQKEEEIKKNQEHKKFITNIHSNIKKAVGFIIVAIIIRFIQIFFISSEFTLAMGEQSIIFSDIFNLIILGLIAYVIRNGEIWVRYLCLFGFLIGILIDVGFIGTFLSNGDYLISVLIVVEITIKIIVQFFLFNSSTNEWYREVKILRSPYNTQIKHNNK